MARRNSETSHQKDTTSSLCYEEPGKTFQFVLFAGLVKKNKELQSELEDGDTHTQSVLASLPPRKPLEAALESQRTWVSGAERAAVDVSRAC